ncbi:hypothetical protein BC936DRAFT_138018 [Jimgerdemannia flammicorona]|uniref:Glycoside hydrolase superfamily n=1 Tax=Jimgerdemannia flammicorona TaxID=994334 RepID=A0A433CVZ9_9FUNG|nr:hypothetical protein BC936DRAFT_138018 [Jimgerdemannia flammicorona]
MRWLCGGRSTVRITPKNKGFRSPRPRNWDVKLSIIKFIFPTITSIFQVRAFSLLLVTISITSPATAIVRCAGVDEAGGNFGAVGGVYGIDYEYPLPSSIDYFAAKGANITQIHFFWVGIR